MKGELNNYSEKLHNLQQRFDQIFYGLTARNSFKTPFDVSNQPTRPARGTAFEANASNTPFAGAQARPRPQANNTFQPPQSVETGNQLAFNVNSPGKFTQDKQVVSSFSPRSSDGGGIGKYLIISPGVPFLIRFIKPPSPIASMIRALQFHWQGELRKMAFVSVWARLTRGIAFTRLPRMRRPCCPCLRKAKLLPPILT